MELTEVPPTKESLGKTSPKVAIYARVSTRDTDQNPEVQLLVLRRYAEQRGWSVVTEYVDTASASDMRGRTAWRRLLADAQSGKVKILLIAKLDRAWRSVHQMHLDLQQLEQRKVEVVAATQDFNTQGSLGRLTLNLLAAFAEFERELIRERTLDGLARAKAKGKRLGRPPGSKDRKQRRKGGYYARYAK